MKRAQKAANAKAKKTTVKKAVEVTPVKKAKGKLELSTVPDEVIAEYREAFSMFDKDGDGAIDIDELRAVLASLGQSDITDEKLQSMFDTMDEDGNGTIDFLEFLSMMTQKMEDVPTESELRDFLKPFDMDGLGSFDIEELKRVVCTVGDKVSAAEFFEILSNIEIDKGTNSASIEDFVQLLHLGASS